MSEPRPKRLTREERSRLLGGSCPRIAGKGPCPWKRGDTIRVYIDQMWLEVEAVRPTADGEGWSLAYHVHDRRDPDRYPRRTPPVHTENPNLPEPKGNEASEESGYTSSPAAAVPDVGIAVPAAAQEKMTADAKAKGRHQRERHRRDQALLGAEARVAAYQQEARMRRIDISSEVRLLNKLKREGRPLDTPIVAIRRKLDRDVNRAA